MGQYFINLTEEEEKAILTDMTSIQDWLSNAIYNKARQCTDEICREALEDKTHTVLTVEEKQTIRDYLGNQGIIITSIKQLPENIRLEIVKKARVKLAAERQAELEAAMKD